MVNVHFSHGQNVIGAWGRWWAPYLTHMPSSTYHTTTPNPKSSTIIIITARVPKWAKQQNSTITGELFTLQNMALVLPPALKLVVRMWIPQSSFLAFWLFFFFFLIFRFLISSSLHPCLIMSVKSLKFVLFDSFPK